MRIDWPRGDLVVWMALLGLLALTVGTSFIAMGRFNLVVNLAIAVAKALLVATFYMRVWSGGALIVIVAITGVAWLSFLAVLGFNDFATRGF